MALTLAQKVERFLRTYPNQRFKFREIGDWIVRSYPEEAEDKKRRSKNITNRAQLVQQYAGEIVRVANALSKHCPQIKVTDAPKKLYYSEASDLEEILLAEGRTAQDDESADSPKELALYQPLCEYLFSEFGLYAQRIDERRSSNSRGKNGNEWLYPDLAGIKDFGEHWHDLVKETVSACKAPRATLWSIEVKLVLNGSNVRRTIFQAVSNSSWANISYLVTTDITGRDTRGELNILCASHGIGLIKFNPDDFDECQLLIPAKEKPAVNWELANRIAEENTDFKEYLAKVCAFHTGTELKDQEWNFPIPQDD